MTELAYLKIVLYEAERLGIEILPENYEMYVDINKLNEELKNEIRTIQ